MEKLEVVEKFVSINGEGTKAGQLAVFVRFKGCNLSCRYCDTKWANEPDAQSCLMTPEEICEYVISTGVKNVTLTGGEPLLRDNIEKVISLLADNNLNIEIETNGSISLKNVRNLQKENVTFTMDYKLSCSGMEKFMDTDNFKLLNMKDTVKFVVGSNEDLLRTKQIIEEYELQGRCNIYISPVFGEINLEDIVNFMKENKLNDVNMQIQMHKVIWAPDKKGV